MGCPVNFGETAAAPDKLSGQGFKLVLNACPVKRGNLSMMKGSIMEFQSWSKWLLGICTAFVSLFFSVR